MPAYVSCELRLVVVAKCQIGLQTQVMVLLIGHEEGEHVACNKFLLHHLVEKRLLTRESESRIGHAYKCFKVVAIEDPLLLSHHSKRLVLHVDLPIHSRVALAQANIVHHPVAR